MTDLQHAARRSPEHVHTSGRRLLFLCEGDAETSSGSFSGSSKSLVDGLRAIGYRVAVADTDLYGTARLLAAALTFSPDRERWSARFRLASPAATLRSRVAARAIARHRGAVDLIFGIGATFSPAGSGSTPYVLYCDSNIMMAQHGATTGQSQAVWLGVRELASVRAREAEIYRGAAAIFTITERLRRSFIADFGIPATRVHTVYAGPNIPQEFTRAPVAPRRSPHVLFVGSRFQRKGGDVLLAAFRLLRQSFPDARLTIVGPRSLTLDEPGVQCLGHLNKDDPAQRSVLMRAYAEATMFCLPTRYEPFGISYVEAMHFGLPCIGTRTGAVAEVIVEGVTGYMVPVDSVEALADRLHRLSADPDTAQRFGEAGRALARSTFTWAAVVRRIEHVLGTLSPASPVGTAG